MTLMHYLCKLLAEKLPELLDFDKDLVHLEAASKALNVFLNTAEAEVRTLISLYTEVGRNADSLSQYFGEDPVHCPFEQVTQILALFAKMFKKARDENEQQAEAEKKRLEKEAHNKEHALRKESVMMDVDHKKDLKNMIRDTSVLKKQSSG